MPAHPLTPPLTDLSALLSQLSPRLISDEWVIASLDADVTLPASLETLATFREPEAVTVICRPGAARAHGLVFDGTYRQITLEVHSSLHAIGLLAAVSTALSRAGIPCNVVSAYFHDHLFIPTALAGRALTTLADLSNSARSG